MESWRIQHQASGVITFCITLLRVCHDTKSSGFQLAYPASGERCAHLAQDIVVDVQRLGHQLRRLLHQVFKGNKMSEKSEESNRVGTE